MFLLKNATKFCKLKNTESGRKSYNYYQITDIEHIKTSQSKAQITYNNLANYNKHNYHYKNNELSTSNYGRGNPPLYMQLRHKTLRDLPSMFTKLFLISLLLISSVSANQPPRFIVKGGSEIVVNLKEGPDTPIGEY